MSEDRRKILEMLSQGQITPDEAERLMVALDFGPAGLGNGVEPKPKPKPKYLRVAVESEDVKGDPVKVNIRVPIQLLRAGVKLASLIPPQARDRVNFELHKEGLPFDLSQINPTNLEELLDHIDDLTVDVDNKRKTVRLSCE
jgi:hypothetical protein